MVETGEQGEAAKLEGAGAGRGCLVEVAGGEGKAAGVEVDRPSLCQIGRVLWTLVACDLGWRRLVQGEAVKLEEAVYGEVKMVWWR